MRKANIVFNNTVYLVLGQIFTIGLGMAWMAFFVRYIGAEGIGQYAYAQSTIAIVTLFVEFGLQNLIIRCVAQNKNSAAKYLFASISTKIALSLLVYGCFFLYLKFDGLEKRMFEIIALVTLTSFFSMLAQAVAAVFYAYEKMFYDAMSQFIQSVAAFLLVMLAIYLRVTFTKILLLLAFASFIRFASNTYFIYKLDNFKFKKEDIRIDWNYNLKLILKSIPFAVLTIVSVIWGNIVILMLRYLSNDTQVGYFSVAQRIYTLLFILPSMFLNAVFPTLSNSYNESFENLIRIYNKSYKYLFALTAPMAIGVMLFAKPIILLLFGEQFSPAIRPLQILGLALLNSVGFVNGAALVAIGKEYFYTIAFGLILIVSVAFSFLIIPRFGVEGASWVVICGNTLGFIIFSYAMFHWLRIKYPIVWLLKVLVATAGMGFVGFIMLPNVPLVIVGAIICPLVYFVLLKIQSTLSNDDLITLKGLWQSSLSTVKSKLK